MIHSKDEQTFKGVLVDQRRDGFVLRACQYVQLDQNKMIRWVPLDGDVVILTENISCWQDGSLCRPARHHRTAEGGNVMMLFRLAGIVWVLAAILAGLWAVFLLGMSETPPGQALGRLLAVGALVAAGNGIFCLFRPSRRVALWSVASAVVWVAVTVAEPDAVTLMFESDRIVFGRLPAVLPALAGLVSLLVWRNGKNKKIIIATIVAVVIAAGLIAMPLFEARDVPDPATERPPEPAVEPS